MPGAAKTTVGRILAERLAVRFFDSDSEIERAAGMTVAQIFERDGEAAFRAMECEVIDRLLGDAPLVLATGGGAMASANSRALLLARAVTIWLDVPVEMLAARQEGTTDHPLLAGDLLGRLKVLEVARTRSYALATHRVSATGSPQGVTAAILAALAIKPARPPAAPAR